MKVLISAYACEPERGSEPGAGWIWASAAARQHEVWVLTHGTNREVLEQAIAAAGLTGRLHPVFLRSPAWARPLRRRGPSRFVYYLIWQWWTCARMARQLHAEVGFDLVHHVTYASDWLPAGVSAVRGIPFVWGPVGGASTIGGPRLWRWLGLRTMAAEALRAVLLTGLRSTVGRATARRATLVLGQNHDVARAFAPLPVRVEPHVALGDELRARPGAGRRRTTGAGASPEALFVGRVLGWKGLRIGLAALRRPGAEQWRLTVLGDGAARHSLQRLSERWGLADRVEFAGWVPREQVLARLETADAVLMPSIHDACGWAVAEAAALGCPVVALRIGGPATLLAGGDGVLVDTDGDVPGNLARGLAATLHHRTTGEAVAAKWRATRLPALISEIYGQAVNLAGAAGHRPAPESVR